MKPTIKFLDISQQDSVIQTEIAKAIQDVISDTAFINSEYVERFTLEFSEYQNAQYCIGVGNGTDALEIIFQGLGLPPNGEVLVPANSFIASAEAVSRSGLSPVFCDCNPETYAMDVDDAARRITKNTVAIMPVHMYGHPCDMDAVVSFAGENGLYIVEDCAQAHGAEYKGRKLGTFGIAGAFSFYPGKNLGAYGDAGAIVTNNEELALKLKMLANHGRKEKFDHTIEGRNSRLDGIQAAILEIKLRYLDGWNQQRSKLAQIYLKELVGLDLILPSEMPWAKHVWHLFVVRSTNRDDLRNYLQDQGVQTGIHYPIALPDLPAYKKQEISRGDYNASSMAGTLLSLPIGPHMSDKDVHSVVKILRQYYGS